MNNILFVRKRAYVRKTRTTVNFARPVVNHELYTFLHVYSHTQYYDSVPTNPFVFTLTTPNRLCYYVHGFAYDVFLSLLSSWLSRKVTFFYFPECLETRLECDRRSTISNKDFKTLFSTLVSKSRNVLIIYSPEYFVHRDPYLHTYHYTYNEYLY